MARKFDLYESPLVARNASEAMARLFGQRQRIRTWRRLWVALADGQRRCGLNISARVIGQLRRAIDDIDFAQAARYEKKSRHDVMAHLQAFADLVPRARPILHLGATSAYVVDNADLVIMRDALGGIRDWLVNVIDALAAFAKTHRSLPALGFTHFQPAQLTTVGKRAILWCYDFVRDLEELETRLERMRFRGLKGATGTQASFMELFEGDAGKIDRLEAGIAREFGFAKIEPVTGQTSSRKVDAQVVGALAGIAASVHKFANDIRLLAHLKEIEEPFERGQVGSSAMAYKRNPMRCERATGLARFVMSLADSPNQTAAEQWFERTLDDSANKRLSIPETFLATDGMLMIVTDVAGGLVVYPKVIESRIRAELPFIASENILMAAVKAGGDRQELHERIRKHAQAAARQVKQHGKANDLIERLTGDPAFAKVEIEAVLDPKKYIGLAAQQTSDFIKAQVTPIRRKHRTALGKNPELHV
ncbi:MAG: adenylosuccinate lyase [Planctomycetes bacterium]|nr:adenylosuccinate lyase [Planctomycetota bacterium]